MEQLTTYKNFLIMYKNSKENLTLIFNFYQTRQIRTKTRNNPPWCRRKSNIDKKSGDNSVMEDYKIS